MASNTDVRYTLTLNDLFTAKITLAANETERLNRNVSNTQNSLRGLAGLVTKAFIINEVVQFGKDVINVTKRIEEVKNQLNFAAGSALQGAEDFDWVRQKSHELGLESLSTAKAFARMNAAAKDTKYAGQGVKDIFEGASMAATVLHLSADETEGTLYALQQMMSKSKISAEELNRQLGNRMPGAVKIFANAMGMSAEQFMKMMKDGNALSSEVLPKVAAYMKNEFSSGVAAARESIQVQTVLMQNAFTELKASLGEIFTPLIKGVTHVLQGLKGLGEFIKTHKSEVLAMATAVGVFTAAYYIHMAATKGLIVLQTILNSAFLASPVGMVTIAIAALAAGIAYCYNEFETFRWAMDTTWEVIKGVGMAIWDSMILPLKLVYHSLKSVVSLMKGDLRGAADEMRYAGNAMLAPFRDIKEVLDILKEAEKTQDWDLVNEAISFMEEYLDNGDDVSIGTDVIGGKEIYFVCYDF